LATHPLGKYGLFTVCKPHILAGYVVVAKVEHSSCDLLVFPFASQLAPVGSLPSKVNAALDIVKDNDIKSNNIFEVKNMSIYDQISFLI
tara:strand:+ start:843 stop:1109 length:267 start_codon:yes stop_codon:yes gene_type:complete